MDTYLNLYKKDSLGYYVCGCGDFGINTEKLDQHMSKIIKDVCINGMKLIDKLVYKCVCGKEFNDTRESEKHYKSRNCMINATDREQRSCKLCNLTCRNIGELKKHENTKRHLEKANGSLIYLTCKTCKITCTSQNQIKEHLETKKHKDMVELGKIADEKISLSCDICEIVCTSQKTIRAHLETKKHNKLAGINDICQSIHSK